MSFSKQLLVPDYIYAARLDEEDIPFFEQQFYTEVDFYSNDIKRSPRRFQYGLRIGHAHMQILARQVKATNTSSEAVALGDQGFAWHFIPSLIGNSSSSYAICAGAGSNITFELCLATQFPNVQVLVLDPSPHAISHVQSNQLPSNVTFIPVGLSDKDRVETFYKPSTPGIGSLSALQLHPGEETIALPVERLITILQKHNINSANLSYLKFDIEGLEHHVIADIISSNLRPTQIAFEFDQPVPPWTVEKTLKRLLNHGYKIVDIWDSNVLAIDKAALSPAKHC